MTNLFRNSSRGALTMQQAIALSKKRMAEHRRQLRQAQELAAQGRGEDTEIAHVARGEYVIPEALQTPEVLAALQRAAADCGVPLQRLNVGNAMNSINPNTGAPEFGFGDWLSGLFGGGADQKINPTAPAATPPAPPPTPMPELESLKQYNGHIPLPGDAYGGKLFDDYSKYPGYASGAYQITGRTYEGIAPKLGISDFSPRSQDLIAIQNMAETGALKHVLRGNFDDALEGMAQGWSTIPQSRDGTGHYNIAKWKFQKAKPYDYVKSAYERNLKKYLP